MSNENPATLFLGTTWEKIENKFLLGSSSTYPLGSTGGNSSVKLSLDNLPSHTHSATTSSHSHTQPTHQHSLGANVVTENGSGPIGGWDRFGNIFITKTQSAGGETTGSSNPVTSIGSTGKGIPFNVMPPYIAINIWKRIS